MNKLQLSFMRLLHNTPVNITNEHMGSQSVLFEGTLCSASAFLQLRCKSVGDTFANI